MTISVIIPAYNVAPYIGGCLDSVINQVVMPTEVIIIVDGATDGTLDIAKAYELRFPQLIKVYYKKNGGLSSARNYGLDRCTGQFITFLDSDDIIDPHFLERHLQKLISSGADISYGTFIEFNDQMEISSGFNDVYKRVDEIVHWPQTERLLGFIPVCGKLYSRSVIDGLRFVEGCIFEDNAFSTLALARSKKVAVTRDAIYRYFIRPPTAPKSITQSLNSGSFNDLLKVYSFTIDELIKTNVGIRFFSIEIHGQLCGIKKLLSLLKKDNKKAIFDVLQFYRRKITKKNALPIFIGFIRFLIKQ